MLNKETVLERVKQLYTDRSLHIRRGCRIDEMELPQITNHLLEEAVELQAALLNAESPEAVLDEAADVLIVFMHIIIRTSILPPSFLNRVYRRAIERIDLNWTNTPSKVTATKPGFSRRNRGDVPTNDDATTPTGTPTE